LPPLLVLVPFPRFYTGLTVWFYLLVCILFTYVCWFGPSPPTCCPVGCDYLPPRTGVVVVAAYTVYHTTACVHHTPLPFIPHRHSTTVTSHYATLAWFGSFLRLYLTHLLRAFYTPDLVLVCIYVWFTLDSTPRLWVALPAPYQCSWLYFCRGRIITPHTTLHTLHWPVPRFWFYRHTADTLVDVPLHDLRLLRTYRLITLRTYRLLHCRYVTDFVGLFAYFAFGLLVLRFAFSHLHRHLPVVYLLPPFISPPPLRPVVLRSHIYLHLFG